MFYVLSKERGKESELMIHPIAQDITEKRKGKKDGSSGNAVILFKFVYLDHWTLLWPASDYQGTYSYRSKSSWFSIYHSRCFIFISFSSSSNNSNSFAGPVICSSSRVGWIDARKDIFESKSERGKAGIATIYIHLVWYGKKKKYGGWARDANCRLAGRGASVWVSLQNLVNDRWTLRKA